MKDVVIVEQFDGYPDGATRRRFRPDPDGNVVSVPNAFADMIVEKGHAKWPKAAAAPVGKPQAAKPKSDPTPEPPADKPAEPATPESDAQDGDEA